MYQFGFNHQTNEKDAQYTVNMFTIVNKEYILIIQWINKVDFLCKNKWQ